MTPTQYIVVTALQSLISAVLFIAYRGASRAAQEAEAEEKRYCNKYNEAAKERHRAVMDAHDARIRELSRSTSQEEVVRAVETLAAALTPRAGAAEACAKADKRPAKRPRRR